MPVAWTENRPQFPKIPQLRIADAFDAKPVRQLALVGTSYTQYHHKLAIRDIREVSDSLVSPLSDQNSAQSTLS